MNKTLNPPAELAESGTVVPSFPPLTAADRCESQATVLLENGQTGRGPCGAQAFIRAVLPSGFDLPFCVHHGDELAASLLAQGAQIIDGRAKVNLKPTDPSSSHGF